MSGLRPAGVVAVGVLCPVGASVAAVVAAVEAGASGVHPSPELAPLPSSEAGRVPGPDLGPYLKRKKDAKMLPRAAQLILPPAAEVIRAWEGSRVELGLFVAVGREPPDAEEAEASLASMGDEAGRLSLSQLGGPGRALYPPLLPLRTLPNMILAHLSILHGIQGENATTAGGPEAGWQALRLACAAVDEGRCPAAIVGAAASQVDLASARDRLRLQKTAPPGEAAIVALVAPGGWRPARDLAWEARFRGVCGGVGAVEGLASLLAFPGVKQA